MRPADIIDWVVGERFLELGPRNCCGERLGRKGCIEGCIHGIGEHCLRLRPDSVDC